MCKKNVDHKCLTNEKLLCDKYGLHLLYFCLPPKKTKKSLHLIRMQDEAALHRALEANHGLTLVKHQAVCQKQWMKTGRDFLQTAAENRYIPSGNLT